MKIADELKPDPLLYVAVVNITTVLMTYAEALKQGVVFDNEEDKKSFVTNLQETAKHVGILTDHVVVKLCQP